MKHQMKILAAPKIDLKKQVGDFVKDFPNLEKPSIAIGRCKFYSMELARYLQNKQIPAQVIHLQGIRDKDKWPNADSQWLERPASEWSHYVVRVGDQAVDITSRQLDPDTEHPWIFSYSTLAKIWKTVERDELINDVVQELK